MPFRRFYSSSRTIQGPNTANPTHQDSIMLTLLQKMTSSFYDSRAKELPNGTLPLLSAPTLEYVSLTVAPSTHPT